MMRRSRISVKPNFRPGNRTGTEGEQATPRVSVAGDTLPAVEAEDLAKPAPSLQQNATPKKASEDVGLTETPEVHSNTNQNDGAPSSGAASSSAAPHRRMRISATPKLVGPKLSSTPRSRPSARMPSSAPSPMLNEEHVQNYESASEAQDPASVISSELPESGTPSKSKSATELPTQSCTTTQSPSPLCVPSTSGLQMSPVHRKNSVEDSPPSPQPGQVPQQSPQEPESECPSISDLSVCVKPSHSDKADSSEMCEKSADKTRILRALKLKELMKIERRKDIQKEKRRVGYKNYTALDRSKMTMRDFIYYLPNTSPMRSSVVHEENPEDSVIPPSPKEQIKTAKRNEEEEEEEEEESENEEMLVPKVRVAEDGSIILDEQSLTVRVQRTSNTKVVENSAAQFERGSTTTYSSFRTVNYVKSWSVRETDLFFLAISMVGTDFSLIGQLLTHRSRKAIKSKFKKEERVNPWRVDKALRNSRPFDKEFFTYLLEKVLAKDKDKKKAIKLVLPKTKKSRRSKGKTSNEVCVDDDDDDDDDDIFHADDHEDLVDDDAVSVENESQDVSTVKESGNSVPTKKRRKRTRDISKGNDNSTEEQVKRKRQRKCNKKTRENSKDDTGGESNLNTEGDAINGNKEDELERSTSASKRRCKRYKSDEGKQNEKPVKEKKCKRNKKSLKVVCDHEEPDGQHEESSIVDEQGSASKKKRKRAKNSDLGGDEPVKGKKNAKRKKALESAVEEEGAAEGGEASADLQEAEQLNAPAAAEVADNVRPKATRQSKKPLPKLTNARSKKRNEPEASAEVRKENQDENNPESILTAAGSPLEDERLQMQPVVVLEKTPPRQQYLLSPSKVNNESESAASPSSSESSSTQQTRMRRAGRVKRDLSTSRKTGRRKGMTVQDEPEPENPMALLESITRESEDEEDNTFNENLADLSCLRDLDSSIFQKRPMVVLSREEVDMILYASEQSAEEDPSVSPLDLSLNTELSFPLQCSKLLEDNDEEAVVDCTFDEHEERTNESASCEARNHEELEITESVLAQHDISDLRDISASLNLEVCSQPDVGLSNLTTPCPVEEAEPQVTHKDMTTAAAVLDAPPSQVVLENVEPLCMKPDAPVTQETVTTEATTVDTSLVVSDVLEEFEKAMLPCLLKEPGLASSEITAQSKLTSIGAELGSQRPLPAVTDMKGEFQTSLEGPSQTLETLQDSSESKEDTQESAMASPEIKASSYAVALEAQEDSQEEVSVQSSSASISSENGIRPTRRSRFLKPKPNLSHKSRATVLQNQRQHLKTPSTLKPKSADSMEKLLYGPDNDQHHSLEDFSKQNLTKEEETSRSNAMDRMESDSTKDLSDTSTAVPDQENITTVSQSLTSADEPQEASECSSSKSDVDMISPCTSLTLPQPSQTRENTGEGQMIVPSEDVCAPAEIVHLTDDGQNDEEPTFILTLYEIPVTESYLPSSNNDSATPSDLPTVETQAFLGFSDQAHSLSSTSESSRIDPPQPQSDLSIVNKDLSENGKEQISVNASRIISPHTKEEDSVASANLEMDIPTLDSLSECKKSSEFVPLDLTPSIHSTTSEFSVSKCSTTLPQDSEDTEQCERVSHMLLDDALVPASEDTGDKDSTVAVESKLQSEEATLASVTEHFTETIREETSHEPKLLDTKDEEGDACGNVETGIPDPNSEFKIGPESDPLEDLTSRTQNTSSGSNISTCITTIHEDADDTEQCERVSRVLLGDVFVPVSEETGDNSSKDGAVAAECKLESNEASTVSVTEDLAENDKEQISEHFASHKPMLVDTKDEKIDAGVDLGPPTESKYGSEIAPLEGLASKTNSTPSGLNISKGITLHQDSEDPEQVSHVLLGDVFVPVSEETGDDPSKDWTMAAECKEASPERQDLPYKELTVVGNLPAVSIPLVEDSKDTPPLSEKTKAPARRRERQKVKPQPKLVKRTCAKVASSKTDEVKKESSQPTFTHVALPASHEVNLPGNSNPTTESGEKMSSMRGNKTSSSKEESPKMSPRETNPISNALHLSREPRREEENSKNVIEDATIKDSIDSFVEDKKWSVSTSSEGANVQPCCEDMHFNLMSSGSGSSTVDSKETEAETQVVSHMVLPDVFVLVSDETDDFSNGWTVSVESSSQKVNLPQKAGTHFQKELRTEDESQTSIEESTQSQSPLGEIETPSKHHRKRADKQEVKRKRTKNDSIKTRPSRPASPRVRTPSAQLSTLPQNDNMLVLEEKLQEKHHIIPCSVRLTSLDTVGQNLSAHQLGYMKSNDKSTVIRSTCHASVTSVSEESSTPPLSEETTVKDLEFEKKSPSRRKGKKKESSPDTKPVQTVSQTRQLTITDWVRKKSCQTATNQEEKQPVESSQMQSSLEANEEHQFMVEKTCSKLQHKDLEEPEGSHLVPISEETKEVNSVSTEVKGLSEMVKESSENSSVSQVKKSPARRRAKLQVKPILSKRSCSKSEGYSSSTTDQPQPTRFTSPTRQHARAAREKEESSEKNKLAVEEDPHTSNMESSLKTSGPHSPKTQDIWPRVVLPRVKLWTTEAGVYSTSSTPTSSPARVSQSVFLPVSPPQLKKSSTQSSSPTTNENPDDDPSRVSQFFLCDIFTEVKEAE